MNAFHCRILLAAEFASFTINNANPFEYFPYSDNIFMIVNRYPVHSCGLVKLRNTMASLIKSYVVIYLTFC